MTAFPDTLHRLVLRGIAEMGFTAPTPIQAAFIPEAVKGDGDLVGLAPTGTGKTLAYGIPLADHLLRNKPVETGGRRRDPRNRLRALVLVPTRELAQQVAEELRLLTRGSVLRVLAAYGKVSLLPQKEALAKGVDIVVATPGRARELIELDAMTLAHLERVVCDEADRMLDMGFLPQVEWVLSRAPEGRIKWLLSATLPKLVEDLVHTMLAKPRKIETGERNRAAVHLAHRRLLVDETLKTPALLSLLNQDSLRRGIVVYCASRRRTGWVAGALRKHEVSAAVVHGDRSQLQREKALESFAHGRCRVLVATDVAARGLHVPGIKLVVNYDVPVSPEEWIHRVGRAGHGGGDGSSITFVTPEERTRWEAVVTLARPEWEAMELPDDVANFMRDRDRSKHERAKEEEARAIAEFEAKARAEKEKAKRLKDASRKRKMKAARHDSKQMRGTLRNTPITKDQKPGRGVKRLG
ncbi:MAG: DEAD/DEAH box helicase [Planctomycetota bacterium]|nr:DEAD/DEAH box helicase [Planctomycetota bacterium]